MRKHDLTMIEDDAACSALTERPLPISALIPERSCYITGVSKALSPALRVGFISAPQEILSHLLNMFHANVLGASPLMAELVGNQTSRTAEEPGQD